MLQENSPAGSYPDYFSGRASYWTVTGVSSDTKEALISEDGTVEPEKGHFSLEPVLKIGEKLMNHSNVEPEQGMGFPGYSAVIMFFSLRAVGGTAGSGL
jgi:hypothetical protein